MAASVVRRGAALPATLPEVGKLARALEENCRAVLQRCSEAEEKTNDFALPAPPPSLKTFSIHIGAELPVPTEDSRYIPPTPQEQAADAARAIKDPFDGMPLRRWAEALGERMMPAYDAIKDHQKQARLDAKKQAEAAEVDLSRIPHILPITRWAAKSKSIRDTFIAEDPKDRKKARLSWYHPDDTMVPRDWFKSGLLADLKYYRPFAKST